ncbi:MAG: hypothetical protein DMG12_00770, partial [Acidobacteria bacterium]
FGALANKTYGNGPFGVSATASSGLAVSFGAAGTCSITGTTVTIIGAGSCSITASQSGNASYNAAPDVLQTFSIGKASLTVTADSKSKQYSDAVPPLTASITGFVAGDTAGVLSGAPSLGTTATTSSAPGTYPISVALGTLTAANYQFASFVPATLTIVAEDAVVTYTGDTTATTSAPTGASTASVVLAAAVAEAADGSLGNTLPGKLVRFSVFASNNRSAVVVMATVGGDNTASVTVALGDDTYTVRLELVTNAEYAAAPSNATVTVVRKKK